MVSARNVETGLENGPTRVPRLLSLFPQTNPYRTNVIEGYTCGTNLLALIVVVTRNGKKRGDVFFRTRNLVYVEFNTQ